MAFDNFDVGSSAVSRGVRRSKLGIGYDVSSPLMGELREGVCDERVPEETGLKEILESLSD